MKYYGHIDLNNNQMQQMVIQAETDFPSTPLAGRVVFKDKRLFICVEVANNIPVWIPLTNEINMYVHSQRSPSTSWTIPHNLNTTTPVVQLYDQNQQMVLPNNITIVNNNTVHVDCGYPMIGRAVVLCGESIAGTSKSQYSYEYSQTSPSTTWVINHDLGYYPLVRVFIGNQEVQPFAVSHDSLFRTTLTFSTPQIGVVRFV